MLRLKRAMLLVCLMVGSLLFAGYASAWEFKPAAFAEKLEDQAAPAMVQKQVISKVKPKRIVKCKPTVTEWTVKAIPVDCILPMAGQRGWQMNAQAMFARTKGKLRYYTGAYGWGGWGYNTSPDVDMNDALGLPEHQVIGTYSISYRFQPSWAVRYSIMPIVQDGTPGNTSFAFGTNLNTWGGWGNNNRSKWERLYQRVGLIYDPVRSYNSRISVFGDYVRVDDKISVIRTGCCGDTMNNDMNMAMVGVEIEKCLKTTPRLNTLSLECKAGVSFLDDAVGSDISTGLKFSVPMNNGRWGYLSGGYRYASLNKKYSDAKLIDTVMEGGYVQMGVIF